MLQNKVNFLFISLGFLVMTVVSSVFPGCQKRGCEREGMFTPMWGALWPFIRWHYYIYPSCYAIFFYPERSVLLGCTRGWGWRILCEISCTWGSQRVRPTGCNWRGWSGRRVLAFRCIKQKLIAALSSPHSPGAAPSWWLSPARVPRQARFWETSLRGLKNSLMGVPNLPECARCLEHLPCPFFPHFFGQGWPCTVLWQPPQGSPALQFLSQWLLLTKPLHVYSGFEVFLGEP